MRVRAHTRVCIRGRVSVEVVNIFFIFIKLNYYMASNYTYSGDSRLTKFSVKP